MELKTAIRAAEGATHVQMVAVGLAPDFEGDRCSAAVAEGAVWELSNKSAAAQVLECNLQQGMQGPLILGMGLRCFQAVNGILYGLKGGDALVVADVVSAQQ